MDLNWKTVSSLVEPQEIDEASSPGGVYLRKNIQSETVKDGDSNEQVKWTYLEAYLTNDEYAMYKLVNNISSTIQIKHEADIIDNYTLSLIQEGIL